MKKLIREWEQRLYRANETISDFEEIKERKLNSDARDYCNSRLTSLYKYRELIEKTIKALKEVD